MSDDFILFIQYYRANDSIAVLLGYGWFVTVCTALGQSKYVAAYHDQNNQMLVKHGFRRYVEALYNRMVRTQPGGHGKHAVAQDEFLGLMNRLFAKFPKVRTLEGMGKLGDCIGPTQRCKRFVQKFYVTTAVDRNRKITWRGSKADQTPERMEIF